MWLKKVKYESNSISKALHIFEPQKAAKKQTVNESFTMYLFHNKESQPSLQGNLQVMCTVKTFHLT